VAQVVGRDPELATIGSFLEGTGPAVCLVLSGEPGIGKTALWEAGLDLARERGFHVLSARTSESEATLSFAALADLMEAVGDAHLAPIPGPQLRALEIALRRADPDGTAPDAFGVAAGFLSVLRVLQEQSPLLVAVDDVQWLDPASSDPLLFAARRLSGGRTRFLLTRRPGHRSELERALPRLGVEHLEVTALSFGAIGRMLSERLGATLSRRALRSVYDGSHGNPLFALELGRLQREGTTLDVERALPVAELADVIFGARIREASEQVRRVLLAVSLSPDLSQAELSGLVDEFAIEEAVASGLVLVERPRVRATHPMIAAAARRHGGPAERQALHLELSAIVTDPVSKARHVAMATGRIDPAVAGVAAEGADVAASRGRVWEAVELGEHALRLTPTSAPEHSDRVISLARFLGNAGRLRQTGDFLRERIDDLPPGRYRALAHLLLNEATDSDVGDEHVEQALAHAGDDPELRALALSARALRDVTGRVRRIDEAEASAGKAFEAVRAAGGEAAGRVAPVLAWARVLRGRPLDDLVATDATSPNRLSVFLGSIDRPLGVRLAFRGQLAAARELFDRLLALAEERGELVSIAAIQMQQCEIELRAGHLPEVARLVDEFEELLVWEVYQGRGVPSYVPRLRALHAAVSGDAAAAIRWAAAVLDEAEASADPHYPGWDLLEVRRALGLAALFEHDAPRAAEQLAGVWAYTRREHVDDPGAFPVAGDLVEALVRAGRREDASGTVEELRRLSLDQEHPWGLATTKRGDALVRLSFADSYDDEAAASLADASATYGELGLDFEQARSMLSLGVIQRRFKKRGAARSSLDRAGILFEQCGAGGWAGQARAELERVSGRRSGPVDQLTPTEQRVVDLAARGMANRDIARQLFVTVKTVEGNLSRAYAKLGVRSRGELLRRLGDAARP
jgi:DNA-binding CsgD family transcriptional regulator